MEYKLSLLFVHMASSKCKIYKHKYNIAKTHGKLWNLEQKLWNVLELFTYFGEILVYFYNIIIVSLTIFNGVIEIRMYFIQFGEKIVAFHFRFKDCEYVIDIPNIKFWTNVLDCKYFFFLSADKPIG